MDHRRRFMERNTKISNVVFDNIINGRGFWDDLEELAKKEKLGDHEGVGILSSNSVS